MGTIKGYDDDDYYSTSIFVVEVVVVVIVALVVVVVVAVVVTVALAVVDGCGRCACCWWCAIFSCTCGGYGDCSYDTVVKIMQYSVLRKSNLHELSRIVNV